MNNKNTKNLYEKIIKTKKEHKNFQFPSLNILNENVIINNNNDNLFK